MKEITRSGKGNYPPYKHDVNSSGRRKMISQNNLRKELRWGYDILYMITGQLNQHPRFAIKFIAEEDRKNIVKFFDSMIEEE